MTVKDTEGRWGIRMSKRELREALASGGLSFIATPKRKDSSRVERRGYEDLGSTGPQDADVEVISVGYKSHRVKIEGVEVEGVTVVEKVSKSGPAHR